MREWLERADRFSEPGWFWLLLLLPLLVFLHLRFYRQRQPALLLSGWPVENPTKKNRKLSFSPPAKLLALRLAALFFLIVALAALVTERKTVQKLPAAGIDIVLALDLSRSMAMEDIKPSRLEALKDVLHQFIASRGQDRLGLVLYAGESLNWCPLTKDYPFVLTRLREMDEKPLADGTAIGLGLASAVNALKSGKSKSKVVILLTDGANNTGFIDPLTAAGIAKKHRVKVYTIGVGTTGLAPFPMLDLDGKKVYQYVKGNLDEPLLKSIAAQTGGKYYRATHAGALAQIYQDIDRLEKSTPVYKTSVEEKPRYGLFLAIALVLLALEQLLKFTSFLSFG